MKKLIQLIYLSAALFSISLVQAQDFEFKYYDLHEVGEAPILDGQADGVYAIAKVGILDRWDISPYEPVSGQFQAVYTEEAIYVLTTIKDPNIIDEDDVGFALDISTERGYHNWESEPKDDDGFFYTKSMGSDFLDGSIFTTRNTEIFIRKTDTGFVAEAKLKWTDLTTDALKLDAMWQRGNLFFDVNFKDDGFAERYVAWCNDDHSSWKESYKMGVANLIPFSPEKDASLSSISIDGGLELDPVFSSSELNYTVRGDVSSVVDPVSATTTNSNAAVLITQPDYSKNPVQAVIEVTSEDESTTNTYIIEFVHVSSVDENDLASVSIYPNPCEGNLYIGGLEQEASVSVYDQLAQIVEHFVEVDGMNQLDISKLDAGAYFAMVILNDGGSRTFKLVKH